MQQQMMMQQQIQQNQNQANEDDEPEQVNLEFNNYRGKPSIMKFKYGTKVYEALNQYIKKTYGYSHHNIKKSFIYNACKIDRNEPKTVEKFFKHNLSKIQVFEY